MRREKGQKDAPLRADNVQMVFLFFFLKKIKKLLVQKGRLLVSLLHLLIKNKVTIMVLNWIIMEHKSDNYSSCHHILAYVP
jgi:hypothetical protein